MAYLWILFVTAAGACLGASMQHLWGVSTPATFWMTGAFTGAIAMGGAMVILALKR